MKKINIALIRLLQFVVFVLFTFMVLTYFGAMILVPLDLIVLIIKILGIVGLGGFIGAFVAVPVVAYLGMIVYKTPGLIAMIVDTGVGLAKTGKAQFDAFNRIADDVNKAV